MIKYFIKLYSFFTKNEKRELLILIIFLIVGMVLEMIGVALIFPVISILQNKNKAPNLLQNFKFDIYNNSLIFYSLLILVIFF